MIKVPYTHEYQLIYNYGIWFSALGCGFFLLWHVNNQISTSDIPAWLELATFLMCFASVYLFYKLFQKTILPPWLPTWLYVNIELRTRINAREAEKVSFLFDGSLVNGNWFPMRDLKKIKKELRRESLFALANDVHRSNAELEQVYENVKK